MNWESIFNNKNNSKNSEITELNFKLDIPVIKVVGTNGKGSVSSFLMQGLSASGKKVGLFTSPHIHVPNERITINGKQISDSDFFRLIKGLETKYHFFVLTLIGAMRYFIENKVDVIILEAGIGGREDTTKLVNGTHGVVTSISQDHTEVLGRSLQSIASQKAGIIDRDMMFYIPSSLDEELADIFIDETFDVNADYKVIDNDGETYSERNAKLAEGVLEDSFGIKFNNFTSLYGRTTVKSKNGFVAIFDVAHNEDGIKESLLKLNETKFDQIVVSIARRKDKDKIIKLLKLVCSNIYVYQPDETFWSAFELNLPEVKDVNEFYKNLNQSTLFIGSFRLIGDIYDKV